MVNLTCGRNPWKQASFEDSTYRAFTRSPDFLKTILPLSNELNDILGRIFARNPDERITLPELRRSIIACPRFTVPAVPTMTALATPPVSPPASPEPSEYVDCQDATIDFSYDAPPSPASSDSDDESTCSSDDGSLFSNCSTIDDDDFDDVAILDDDMDVSPEPQVIEPPESKMHGAPQEFVSQYTGPVGEPCQPCQPYSVQAPIQAPISPASCAPRFGFPYLWEVVNRYAPAPIQNPMQFHHQVTLFNGLQGCY